jgi:hypothetical protein
LGAYLDREFPDSLGSTWEIHGPDTKPDVPTKPIVVHPVPPNLNTRGLNIARMGVDSKADMLSRHDIGAIANLGGAGSEHFEKTGVDEWTSVTDGTKVDSRGLAVKMGVGQTAVQDLFLAPKKPEKALPPTALATPKSGINKPIKGAPELPSVGEVPSVEPGQTVRLGDSIYIRTSDNQWLWTGNQPLKIWMKHPFSTEFAKRKGYGGGSVYSDEMLQRRSLDASVPLLSQQWEEQMDAASWAASVDSFEAAKPRLAALGIDVSMPSQKLSAEGRTTNPQLHGQVLEGVVDFIESNPEIGDVIKGYGELAFGSSKYMGAAPNPMWNRDPKKIKSETQGDRNKLRKKAVAFAARAGCWGVKVPEPGVNDQIEASTGESAANIELAFEKMDATAALAGMGEISPDDKSHALRVNGESIVTWLQKKNGSASTDGFSDVKTGIAVAGIRGDFKGQEVTWNGKPVDFSPENRLVVERRGDGTRAIYRRVELSGTRSKMAFGDLRRRVYKRGTDYMSHNEAGIPWTIGRPDVAPEKATAVHEMGHIFAGQLIAPKSDSGPYDGKSTWLDHWDAGGKLSDYAKTMPRSVGWQILGDFGFTPDEIRAVSQYSQDNPNEAFAELFTAYHLDVLAPEPRAKFEKLLATMLEGKRLENDNAKPIKIFK